MALFVNGEAVDDALIRQEAAAIRPRHLEMIEDMDPIEREMQIREWSRENVIERVLLRQEAAKETAPIPEEQIEYALSQIEPPSSAETSGGVSGCSTPDAAGMRTEVEARLKIDRLLARVTAKVPRPRNKEVGDYYKKNREQFLVDTAVRAAHVVKNVDEQNTEETALAAIKEAEAALQAGADFHEVADRFSDCAGNGGDLGYFARGQMVEEFDHVVFNLRPGEVSPVFRTMFGFHIAKLLDRREAGYRLLNDVKDQIEEHLFREKQQQAIERFVDELRAKAEIKDVKETRA